MNEETLIPSQADMGLPENKPLSCQHPHTARDADLKWYCIDCKIEVPSKGGRPPGVLNKKTKELKIIEEEFRNRILENIQELLTAQMNLAKGASYMFRKEGDESILVTDVDEIKRVLTEAEGNGVVDEKYYYISTKYPDNRALDSLMDRVFGRAPQTIDAKLSGEVAVITGMKVIKDNGDNIQNKEPETTPSS